MPGKPFAGSILRIFRHCQFAAAKSLARAPATADISQSRTVSSSKRIKMPSPRTSVAGIHRKRALQDGVQLLGAPGLVVVAQVRPARGTPAARPVHRAQT